MKVFYSCLVILAGIGFGQQPLAALTANKVWFEFRDDGRYVVKVNYTIPERKEYREAYVIFDKKKEAEAFYWQLIRGADFYPDDPRKTRYEATKLKPTPW